MKNAIGYIRCSTKEQEEQFGFEMQKQAILSYAHIHGFAIVEWAKDTISGASAKKPAWDSLVFGYDVKNPPYQAIIVFKYDRISRDMFQLCYNVWELKRKNIELHSVHDDMNLDKPENKLMLSVVGYCAEKERENITLRTSAGRRIKADSGGYSGGAIPYGYTSLHGRLVENPSESPIVRMIYEMRQSQKMSLLAIANYLNESGIRTKRGSMWTATGVKNIIDNERFYRGEYKYGKNADWVQGEQEAILK